MPHPELIPDHSASKELVISKKSKNLTTSWINVASVPSPNDEDSEIHESNGADVYVPRTDRPQKAPITMPGTDLEDDTWSGLFSRRLFFVTFFWPQKKVRTERTRMFLHSLTQCLDETQNDGHNQQ